MKLTDAKKLHNGDEVISKDNNGESIKVLSVEEWPNEDGSLVRIEGVGTKSGYRWWTHTEVR